MAGPAAALPSPPYRSRCPATLTEKTMTEPSNRMTADRARDLARAKDPSFAVDSILAGVEAAARDGKYEYQTREHGFGDGACYSSEERWPELEQGNREGTSGAWLSSRCARARRPVRGSVAVGHLGRKMTHARKAPPQQALSSQHPTATDDRRASRSHRHAHARRVRGAAPVASAEAFDALANIVNMVGLTVQHDPAFLQQYLLINGAARTMNQIGAKVEAGIALRDHEIASLTVAVSAIDDILPRIDVARLFINEHIAVALVRAGQTRAQPCPTTR